MKRALLALAAALIATPGCTGGQTSTTTPEAPAGRQERLAGLASFTAQLLRRGAGERTAEQIDEEIEFVGGDLWTGSDPDMSWIYVRVMPDRLDLAMELLADVAQRPTFAAEEIEILRRRELDRLSVERAGMTWLPRQAFYRYLYGPGHPYADRDAEPAVISRLTRDDLVAFHGEHYVPRNAFLVAAGDVERAAVLESARRYFGAWQDRPAPAHEVPPAPEREARSVVVIDRPGATQAQIYVGNVALERDDPDYIRLAVANTVLGGTASARLFMNLRERCGFSYGVYSSVVDRRGQGPLLASGVVDADNIAGALRELFAELDRVVASPPPAEELAETRQYLAGLFPLMVETAGAVGEYLAQQRLYGLPDDYWDTYRSSVMAVTAEQARDAAARYIQPDRALVVLLGDASRVAEPARRYGPVTIVNEDGEVTGSLEAAPGQWPGGEPPACPAPSAAETAAIERQLPGPAQARDISFPDVDQDVLDNGLQVLTVRHGPMPVVYLRLVVRSGSSADPLRDVPAL